MYCTYFQLKEISQQTNSEFLNHGTIEWFLFFFFSEVKASKTRQHTLTNIRAKISFRQRKIKCHPIIGLQCFSSQKLSLDTSVMDQCFSRV